MKLFPREAWSYAFLLIILFAIAAVAARETIVYLEDQVSPQQIKIVTALITSLTLGFMLIAGAFGMWAIQFSASAETRRRIGRIVDAMDYLSDGLIVIDRRGRIRGSNPAVGDLLRREPEPNEALETVFPILSDEDRNLLLSREGPNEVERKLVGSNTRRVLRFRSQPSEGLTLIIVSDITAMNEQRERHRQIARLQLIGQLARGVAHDFNSLLCAIAGHAGLLPRLPHGSSEQHDSIEAITRNAERGVALAGHLLQLAQPYATGSATHAVGEHLKAAAAIVRDGLPEGWRTELSVEALPPIAIPGIQLEQIVANLGILLADAMAAPGLLRITARCPHEETLFNVDPSFAAVVTIEGSTNETVPAAASHSPERDEREMGIIQSVVRSLLNESGGGLDCLSTSDGTPVYRLKLAPADSGQDQDAEFTSMPFDLGAYVRGWKVVLGCGPGECRGLTAQLQAAHMEVIRADRISAMLVLLEEQRDIDAVVVDRRLLGSEARGLIKAMLKLRPATAFTELVPRDEEPCHGLGTDVTTVALDASPGAMLTAMIEARSLAARRMR